MPARSFADAHSASFESLRMAVSFAQDERWSVKGRRLFEAVGFFLVVNG